ncbi:MAG: hypothetical protein HFE39_10925 [Clostridiales bacterium]|jgi:hypothetical protein|nr:hypothetical protein [Clostridiales bacterium]
MKQIMLKSFSLSLMLVLVIAAFAGCSSHTENNVGGGNRLSGNSDLTGGNSQSTGVDINGESTNNAPATELAVRFGDDGEPFVMHLYDNETARAIARHVGTSEWRLPIYHYEGYKNWEVMQYYDIPSRYEIPSNPETVTKETAGAVYYSEPNRIVLFYGDAEVTGEYTPVGYFDNTEEFRSAVEDNPVLEGWGNKIVRISDED